MQYPTPGRGLSPAEGQDAPTQPSQDTTDILEAIKGIREALEHKMDTMAIDINHLHLDIRKVVERITNTEEEVKTLWAMVEELQTKVIELNKVAFQNSERLEDAKGRSRRITSTWWGSQNERRDLPQNFSLRTGLLLPSSPCALKKIFTVERAHRALGPTQKPGAPLRAIISRLLNHRDRDLILQHVRSRAPLTMRRFASLISFLTECGLYNASYAAAALALAGVSTAAAVP
ncbi:hypothetical protein NDU88_002332 [Pleurodeles waltl]|uniref:Transposase n=1 Tax=Pleurodeles waltl TaxID=8319 RepID=A0AAV7U9G8_PLEWA|nr:hypothetical protein NDU88_002332 [Pleurodeles waltl]